MFDLGDRLGECCRSSLESGRWNIFFLLPGIVESKIRGMHSLQGSGKFLKNDKIYFFYEKLHLFVDVRSITRVLDKNVIRQKLFTRKYSQDLFAFTVEYQDAADFFMRRQFLKRSWKVHSLFPVTRIIIFNFWEPGEFSLCIISASRYW